MYQWIRRSLRDNPLFKKGMLFAIMLVVCAVILGSLWPGFTGAGAGREFVYLDEIPLSRDLQRYTFDLCQQHGLEYELVLAVMFRESGFRVNAVGVNTNGTRDSGLMQINDVNRGWLSRAYGIDDLMDPYQNIRAGVTILADYMNQYGDEYTALMAYNVGEGGLARLRAAGVRTNALADQVLPVRDRYRELMGEQKATGLPVPEVRQMGLFSRSAAEDYDAGEQSRAAQTAFVEAGEPDAPNAATAAVESEGKRFYAVASSLRVVEEGEVLDAYRRALPDAVDGVVTVELRGRYDHLPLEVQRALHRQAEEDGVTAVLRVGQLAEGAVVSRVTLNPAEATKALDLALSWDSAEAARVEAFFEKWFQNNLRVLVTAQEESFGQEVKAAVSLDLGGIEPENLTLYRYSWESNRYDPLEGARAWVDGSGYLHLITDYAGIVVLSDGALRSR